jgi:ATP-dependent Clp protease ATP-binding subunit ClpC
VATLHVRNVPDDVYEALRVRAEREGRSIGAQAIAIIAQDLTGSQARGLLRRRARAVRGGPFQRFTASARSGVVAAEEEARALGHDYVGTEHILLGLLREGTAARALATLGVTAEKARERVVALVGEGSEPVTGKLRFSSRAKKALELALREALSFGHDYVGSEHVLLGLACEGESAGAQVLRELGADEGAVRFAVYGALSRPGAEPPGSEYRAVALAGSADAWTEQLNALGGEGWDLFAVSAEHGEPRAIFRRG